MVATATWRSSSVDTGDAAPAGLGATASALGIGSPVVAVGDPNGQRAAGDRTASCRGIGRSFPRAPRGGRVSGSRRAHGTVDARIVRRTHRRWRGPCSGSTPTVWARASTWPYPPMRRCVRRADALARGETADAADGSASRSLAPSHVAQAAAARRRPARRRAGLLIREVDGRISPPRRAGTSPPGDLIVAAGGQPGTRHGRPVRRTPGGPRRHPATDCHTRYRRTDHSGGARRGRSAGRARGIGVLALDRGFRHAAPFGPRPVVDADVVAAEQVGEDEPGGAARPPIVQ